MATLTLRNEKGSSLSHDELDSNFLALDSDITNLFAVNSTSDLSEGTNLYYTMIRVDSDIDARIDSDSFVRVTSNQTIAGLKNFTDSTIFSGPVGIGEDQPEGALHLKTTSGDTVLILEADPTNTDDNDSPYITFRADGSSATSAMIGLAGGNNNFVTGVLANALVHRATGTRPLQFVTGDSVAVTINSSGDVGFGTTAPTVPFHVTGNAIFSGTLNANTLIGNGSQITNVNAATVDGFNGIGIYDSAGTLLNG